MQFSKKDEVRSEINMSWWCPTCKSEIEDKTVTYEEYHDVCGTFLSDCQPTEVEKRFIYYAFAEMEGKCLNLMGKLDKQSWVYEEVSGMFKYMIRMLKAINA
jgi:hypothetical protein